MDWKAYLTEERIGLATSYALKVIAVLAILVIANWIANFIKKSIEKKLTGPRFDETLTRFLANAVRIVVLTFAVVSCLGVFGIQTASFAAVLAAAGFAVGMALQGTLSNFASGVMLLAFRPFKVGDVITAAGQTGKVFAIDIFTTILDTPDNRRIIVPNGAIFSGTIENVTHHATRRVDVNVGTAYDADLDLVRKVLTETAGSVPSVLKDPAPQIVLGELGASSIDWTVRLWGNTEDYWGIKENATTAIKKALDAQSIGIPFPQMDVHFPDSVDTSVAAKFAPNQNGSTQSATMS